MTRVKTAIKLNSSTSTRT